MKTGPMSRRILISVLCALVLVAPSSIAAEPAKPEPYPSPTPEQWDQWTRLIVVAELAPGQHHAAKPCPTSDTKVYICLDGAPFWYRAKALREEVFQDNFDDGAALAQSALQRYGVKKQTDLYRISATGAWPRYVIAIEGLRDLLQKAGPGVQMSCEEKPLDQPTTTVKPS